MKDLSKRWLKLLMAVVLILIFTFGMAPLMSNLKAFRTLAISNEELGIESTALWWSEVELVSTAETNCRNTIRFNPQADQ